VPRTNVVYCFDANTGTSIWTYAYGSLSGNGGYGPQATPAVSGNELYTLDEAGTLYCFNKVSGAVLWYCSVAAYGRPGYGFAGSPVVEGNHVILNASGAGVAVNRTTHAVDWPASPSGTATYATPKTIYVGGQRLTVMRTESGLSAVNPASGAVAWTHDYTACGDAAADPVVVGDRILLYESGLTVLKATATNVTAIVGLNGSSIGAAYVTPVAIGDRAYAVNSDGDLVRIDLSTGTTDWNLSLGTTVASLMAAGDKLVVVAGGRMRVFRIGATGFDEEGRMPEVITPSVSEISNYGWTSPAHWRGKVYCRVGRVLKCYQVTEHSGVDANGNGMDDGWELAHFGTLTNTLAWYQSHDSDGDGMKNWGEYVAGTDPWECLSCLAVSNLVSQGDGFVIRWASVAERVYNLYRSTNLLNGFNAQIGTNLPATPPMNVHTDNAASGSTLFYRVGGRK
jgi:outer membrane protein assembly factor BamB